MCAARNFQAAQRLMTAFSGTVTRYLTRQLSWVEKEREKGASMNEGGGSEFVYYRVAYIDQNLSKFVIRLLNAFLQHTTCGYIIQTVN